MNHDGSTFQCGCAPFHDLIFFVKTLDELVEDDTENSSYFAMFEDEWIKYDFDANWYSVAMATIKPPNFDRTVVAVSPRGAYWELNPNTLQEKNGSIVTVKHSIRSLSSINNQVFACCMGRSVLQRKAPGDWEEIGPTMANGDENSVIGFEDIDGFSTEEMYAVGWGGEIWLRKDSIWRRLDSPVSANFNAVCCATDENVYIVGDRGIMLRGRNEKWEVLDTDRTDNLMDVAFFRHETFIATDFEILKLENDLLVEETTFANPDDLPGTCLHLLTAQDALISMGPKDLFRFYDGLWERIV